MSDLVLQCQRIAGGVIATHDFSNVSFVSVDVHGVGQHLAAFGFHAVSVGVVQTGGTVEHATITSFGFGVTLFSRNNGTTRNHRLSNLTIRKTWGHAICVSGGSGCEILGSRISGVNRNAPVTDDCVFVK